MHYLYLQRNKQDIKTPRSKAIQILNQHRILILLRLATSNYDETQSPCSFKTF